MRISKIAALTLALAAATTAQAADPVLVIHGGAGVIRRDNNRADEAAVRKALETALRNGYAELKAGKSSTDAVVAALRVLEDDPHFNAGKGAVFTHDGKNEMDASIMEGEGQRAGAVAAVHRVRNPITLARAVMDHSEHVMLVGDGAEKFAKEQGITIKWSPSDNFNQLINTRAQANDLPDIAMFPQPGVLKDRVA